MIFMVINSHRECIYFNQPVIINHFAHTVVQSKNSKCAPEEIGTVIIGMKTDEVGTIESFKNLFSPFTGQQAEYLIGGKWNVQEKTNLSIGHFFSQHAGQQHEMVVMNPYSV